MERLEELRAQGAISEDKFETLRRALEAKAAKQAAKRSRGARLCKRWHDRRVAGVCAGLADYSGIDAWRIRAIFLLALFVSAGTGVLVYFALAIALPWADKPAEGAGADGEAGGSAQSLFPWGFISALGAVVVADFGITGFYLPRLIALFANTNQALPASTRAAVGLTAFMRSWPVWPAIYLVGPAAVVGVYLILPPNGPGRRAVAAVTIIGGLAFLAFLVFGMMMGSLAFDNPTGWQIV
ncbi:MAG: PspC domain-containing protein [Candidatus Hydrogenedentes bacterium]|nr:PspC domain-containing protein [Candidatus Hydrogenedentota bacterium]